MILGHPFPELITPVSAQTHIWSEQLKISMTGRRYLLPMHTCEHALEFGSVFETAHLLQLRDHARLGFLRYRLAVDKAVG